MKFTTLLARKSDNMGIISSILCLIHCLLLPIVVSALSVAKNHIHDHAHDHGHDHAHAHGFSLMSLETLDYVFWVFSLLAVYYSMRQTTHKGVKLAFVGAGLLFTLGILFSHQWAYGHTLAYAGSFCLIFTHYYNMRYCKHCAVAHR